MGAALPALGVPTGAAFYDAALEGLVRTNEEILSRSPQIPPMYEAGVTYKVTGSRQWAFADQIASAGHADCEGLSGWRAAELRVSGEDPEARARTYRTGKSKFHAVVERGDGTIEDPSAILGMPIKSPTSYIGKLVNNFGEAALEGDDDGSSTDDFYNAAPPNEDSDERGSEIDNFYNLDPQQGDLGPGVGPADSTYDGGGGGGGSSDSGGGGGGGGGAPDSDSNAARARGQGQQGQQQGQQRGQGQQGQQQQQRPTSSSSGRSSSSRPSTSSSSRASRPTSSSSGSGMRTAPPPIKPPKPAFTPKKQPLKRGGKTRGVDGVIDVPFICLEGPGDDDLDRGSFDPDEESGPDDAAGFRPYDPDDDTRDVSVDIQETGDGGYVSTVRVPVAGGNTVVAQSSKAATAKKAATKAFNIAKILGNNKTVQDAMPPTARVTMAALKSPDAAKIFQQLRW